MQLAPALAVFSLAGALALAQTPVKPPPAPPQTAAAVTQALPTYEGQPVASVELAGRPNFETAPWLAQLPLRAGQPFARARLDAAVALLKRTGQFADVTLDVRPEASGVRVLLILQPAVYFGLYTFPGAGSFSYARLLQVSNYPVQEPYTADDVRQAAAALQAFFQHEGHFEAKLSPKLNVDAQHGLVNVAFATQLGPRAHIGAVHISGLPAAEAAHFQAKLASWAARFRDAAVRPGHAYSLRGLQNATQYLQGSLASAGYLAAQVSLAPAVYDPADGRAAITFNVKPGAVIHVRVEGAHLWPWTRHRLLPMDQQAGVDPELIAEGRQNLLDYFGSRGYFDAQVVVATEPPSLAAALPAAGAAGAIETIEYRIAKGPRHEVASVRVSGTTQDVPASEAAAQVKIRTAHLFSHGDFSPALLNQSTANLQALYRDDGYNSVQVTAQVNHPGGNVAVNFAIVPGARDLVAALAIDGAVQMSPSDYAPHGLHVGAGRPFAQKLVELDRNEVMAQYLDHGFLNASFRATAERLPGQPHRLRVTYLITEGPRVHTATVVTEGRQVARQRLVDRATSSIQPEADLSQRDLLAAETRLYNTGVFDWAEIDPRRPITTQTQEDVVVKLHEAARNTLTYGVGFEFTNRGGSIPSGTVAVPGLPPVGLPSSFKTSEATFYGPTVEAQYTRLDIGGKADALSLGTFAGRLDQRGSASFSNPYFLWSGWSTNVLASGEHNSENPIFTSRQAQVGYQLQHPLNRDKTSNVFLRYSFSETGLTRLLIPALVPASDLHVRLSTVSITFTRDTRDNALDAHRGIYESAEVDYNPSSLGSSVDFARFLGQAAYYHAIPDHIIWANSLRLGLEQAFAGSQVPLSEQFFSGGGSTLRGFPLDGAGPQRTIPACGNAADPTTCSLITVPVGGNEMLIVNSELRIPLPVISGLGMAAFYDGGNVYSRVGFTRLNADYSNTVGLGLRYGTPVGPVRIDLGHLLNAAPGIKSTQFFVTLGQAF